MTPPNLFRFVRIDKRILYNGYDLQEDESFGSSTWGITNYSTAGFSSQEDESFGTSTWGITNYSTAGFSSQEDISFESGSLGDPDFAFNVVIQP